MQASLEHLDAIILVKKYSGWFLRFTAKSQFRYVVHPIYGE